MVAKVEQISPATLATLLRYESETGRLFWRYRPTERKCWNTRYAGKPALTAVDPDGYLHGRVLNLDCKAHRAIWAIVTGSWPVEHVDHVNGVRLDNRWMNLREANNQENRRNQKKYRGTSVYKGVSWRSDRRTWRAAAGMNGKNVHLGHFATEEEAARAYDTFVLNNFGAFAHPNER